MSKFNRRRRSDCGRCAVHDPAQMMAFMEKAVLARFQAQWLEQDRLGREAPEGFAVVLPHEYRRWLEKGPCPDCPCGSVCDRPCALWAQWWDVWRKELMRRVDQS